MKIFKINKIYGIQFLLTLMLILGDYFKKQIITFLGLGELHLSYIEIFTNKFQYFDVILNIGLISLMFLYLLGFRNFYKKSITINIINYLILYIIVIFNILDYQKISYFYLLIIFVIQLIGYFYYKSSNLPEKFYGKIAILFSFYISLFISTIIMVLYNIFNHFSKVLYNDLSYYLLLIGGGIIVYLSYNYIYYSIIIKENNVFYKYFSIASIVFKIIYILGILFLILMLSLAIGMT